MVAGLLQLAVAWVGIVAVVVLLLRHRRTVETIRAKGLADAVAAAVRSVLVEYAEPAAAEPVEVSP